VPVTVTVSRSNPLPVPIALLFTVVGATLIVAGFAWVPRLPDFEASNIIMKVIAGFLIIPTWVIYLLVVVRNLFRPKPEDDLPRVPDEIADPPSEHDVAIVATLIGDGAPGRRAIAGTVLALAARRQLSINEYGERVVIQVEKDAEAKNEGEQLVLGGLRDQAQDDGDIVGPPIWKERVGWWGAFRKDARTRAAGAGLAETRIPLIGLMLVLIFTATGFSILFFDRLPVFIGSILLANGLPHLIARGSGYRLSRDGRQLAKAWQAFGRYLHRHESFREAGPAGVVMWGPNLVYGAVLGVAERAARPLTPGIEDEPDEEILEITRVYEL
jgi:hypothetical protein